MNAEPKDKKPLGKFFTLSLRLQWQLTGWRSLVFPVFDVGLTVISIWRSYLYAQIINLIGSYLAGRVETVFPQFWWLIIITAATGIFEPVARNIQNYFSDNMNRRAEYKLDQLIAKRCSELDAQYFEDPKFQDVLSRVQRLNVGWIMRNLSGILSDIVTIAISAVAVLRLNWLLFFIAIVATLPRLYSSFYTAGRYRKINIMLSEKRRLNWYLRDNLTEWRALMELRPAGAIKSFFKRMVGNQQEMLDVEMKAQKKFSLIEGASDVIGIAASVVSRVWLFLRIISTKGSFGLGDYTFYDSLISRLENSSSSLVRNIRAVYEELINVEDYFILMNSVPVVEHRSDAIVLKEGSGIPTIEFRNVSFTYPGTQKKVLNGLSFHLQSGQKMALIGVNGAGKTTIVKLLLRFYDPSEGQILVDGVDLKDINLESWYKKLAIIQQDFNRYPLTVAQNITFDPIGRADTKRLKQAISDAQADFVYDLPKAEKTVLTRFFDDSVDLSGGQWQKIALARAFYRQAEMLVLDEPTSAIDARAEAAIFHRLWQMQKDKGAIVISHRFSTVRDADLIVVIDNGKIAELGNHELLMKKGGVYHELFTKQAKSYQ
ncbi:ABC transporter ATP-binding protein [bacterium]|nr:ABC transporter ATP-binding protein [bacterium]